MDFLKKFLKNVLPVNQIIKFIIKQFLSSYLVIKENDLEEKPQENSGLKNLININDLELNVSNINHEHLLHSPIKLLKGNLGKFSLDITEENKIIISIEDVSMSLMPLFNYYKKYQETIFNMQKTKKDIEIESQQENKNAAGIVGDNVQANPKTQNTYMLNMANKLLTNLEINIKNISIKLFTYEIGEKIIDNPVFSLFIMNVNIYKNEKNIKKENLIDPNTKLAFEDIFLNNLLIEFDKICIKVDQNLNEKDNKEFKEIKEFCNNKTLTKSQQDRILSFFIAYNTIFAMNYKKGPCLTIKLNTKPRIEKYKEESIEKEKIIEDMKIEIDIFEAESIITPHQLFNIQILSQISNFIFILNKNTPNKEDEKQGKKNNVDVNEKIKENINEKKNEDNNSTSSSGIFKKNTNEEMNDDFDLKISYNIKRNNDNDSNDKKNEIKKNTTILSHEISKFNITMNAKRIILVLLENNNNESIPKLFSFLMEDEIACQNKNKNKKKKNNTNFINFDISNDSLENYYCYFEDNILYLKIENIKSINTDINSSINISSIIAEYIKLNMSKDNINNKNNNEKINNNQKSSLLQASVYDSMYEFDEFKEVGSGDEDEFQSAIEKTELLLIENYHNYINNFLEGVYQTNKFEILIINEIKYNNNENILDIKEIFINLNYIIILLYVKLSTQINYFIDTNKKMFTTDDIIEEVDLEENLNVNLEKKINDSELQLLKNLKKKYNKINSNNNENNNKNDEDDLNISINDSIEYSEEEKNKKDGMKININYISIKVYNILKNNQRYDNNIYYYQLFLDIVYPNISNKLNKNIYIPIEQQSLYNIISKDYIEIAFNNTNMIYYSISNTNKINIVFQELLFKYWNYVVIQYNNTNKKNNINENPNVAISTSEMDIIMDFSDKIRINLEKTIIDDLLSFNNTFLYGLSMYQIFNKYCGDLFNNKLINLFDLFGLKNHFLVLKQLNKEEENKEKNPKIINNKQKLQDIKKQINVKPSMYIGGRIASCVININKNGTFEEREGNLIKLKIVNIGVSLDMFSGDVNDNNKNKEPIYNNLSISINNIYFLIKENPIPKEGKPKYYNLFSKNKSPKCESIDYFIMSFKFRNIKKIREDLIIEEDDDEDISDGEIKPDLIEKEEKQKKNNNKFEISKSKIVLDHRINEYIAFLLNNQVKLDNMEMVIDINISEMVFGSFYHKINSISSSLNDLYTDFTSKRQTELDGINSKPSDLIPLCEERVMIIKFDFNIKHLLIDIFLKEDKDQKNWMRLLYIMNNFKFSFNENGIFLILENSYIYFIKDFNYIYHIVDNLNNNNIFDIEDKIIDIIKEDSYLKRLGYVELFYDDKIEIDKIENELNVNLGNINLFFCKDSFNCIFEFKNVFIENYLDKIKNIFAHETLNSDDDDDDNDSNEDIEKEKIKKQNSNNKDIQKDIKEDKSNKDKKDEKKEKGFIDDFEVLDDIFFMDNNKKQNECKNKNILENKYLKKNSNSLRTIPEEKKSKKNNKKEEFKHDFMIIETKSSLERKLLRKEKEEESTKYSLELYSLRLYLFSGNDFSFQDDIKKDLDLSSPLNNNEDNLEEINNEDGKENNCFFDIDTNYLFKYKLSKKQINKKVLQLNKRNKIEQRDYNNYIIINIINLSFKIIDYCYCDFIIDNFFIDDNFQKSEYKKIISKHDYMNEISKFLLCKIEVNKNKENNRYKDVSNLIINIIVPSLDIFIDQLPLTFIIKFMLSNNNDKNNEDTVSDKNSYKSEEKISNDKKNLINEEDSNKIERINSKDSWNDEEIESSQSLTYVKDISINSFIINFHYNSHKISFQKLISKGDWLELLNMLADIKDLNLKFKQFTKNIKTELSELISELFSFWKDDILQNQITNSALRGFTLTRPFFKLYDGVVDLIWQPYISYKENEGIHKGIQKGMKSFLFSFSSQGLFFGEKIFRGMKIVVFRNTKLSLKKKSLYKTWVYKINKEEHDYEMHYYK